MAFSLRLHILQSGKETDFERLFKAERMISYEDLLEELLNLVDNLA